MDKGVEYYRKHIQNIIDELGPVLDQLDDSEWDDHFEVRNLVDQQRELQKELQRLRHELRHLKKNRQAEIDAALAEKTAEVEEVKRNKRYIHMHYLTCIAL